MLIVEVTLKNGEVFICDVSTHYEYELLYNDPEVESVIIIG